MNDYLCIFDLDGTLLNTIADLGAACNTALKAHGFPEHELRDYPHLVGNGVNKLLERALPEGHKDTATIMTLRETFVEYYDSHNRIYTKPYEGVKELIAALKTKGYKLAVASNKYQSATETIVKHYFGNDTFDVILGERPSCPRKPDPQIVYDITESLKGKGMSPHPVIFYTGDSDVDMLTAHNAAASLPLVSIACTWGFCTQEVLQEAHPDHIINTPEELIPIVDMMSGRLYDACSPNLLRELNDCKDRVQYYNNLRPTLLDERRRMIQTLIHTADDKVFVNQPFYCDYGSHIRVGQRFFSNFNFTVLDEALVSIGDDCFIGPNVSIYTACHSTEPVERNTRREWAKPVAIGDNVWIGGSVTILPGVSIGNNVTIGAGSVVTRDLPDNVIAAGNPAKVLRRLE